MFSFYTLQRRTNEARVRLETWTASGIYCQGEEEPMGSLGFHVTRAFIEKLHRLQLELDVDQYVFSRESDSASLIAHD